MIIEGDANSDVGVRFVKWDDSESAFVNYPENIRSISNNQGGRDVGIWNIISNIFLDENDYVKLQVSNSSTLGNLTVEVGSYFMLEERT